METSELEIDKRILNLSYSSLLTLHSCPRKFQLYKLGADVSTEPEVTESVTFAYGHVIGSGIQHLLEGMEMDEVIWKAFLEWDCDLFADNPKQNKSFFGAIHALRQFDSMRANGYLAGYEIVRYKDKPACELSFAIRLPDGFIYRGFVDAVLRNTITGKVIVLECKTTSSTAVNPAQYKNSAQAIGYSIVLDAIFPILSDYEVLYLAYQSKSQEYIQLSFNKSYYQRALWIQELLLDIEVIKLYEREGIYPMRGESCFSWYRECEYYNNCTLSTNLLTAPLSPEGSEALDKQLEEYQIQITLEDLVRAQLTKPHPHSQALRSTPTTSTEDEIL